MAFTASTTNILNEIRTQIGGTVTDGTTTLTWKWKLEGPPLRHLEEQTDYPALVLEPGDTEGEESASQIMLDLPVMHYVIIKASRMRDTGAASAKAYETVRLFGEAALTTLMDSGNRLGGSIVDDRNLTSFGVDYATTEEVIGDGLLVYAFGITYTYYSDQTQP